MPLFRILIGFLITVSFQFLYGGESRTNRNYGSPSASVPDRSPASDDQEQNNSIDGIFHNNSTPDPNRMNINDFLQEKREPEANNSGYEDPVCGPNAVSYKNQCMLREAYCNKACLVSRESDDCRRAACFPESVGGIQRCDQPGYMRNEDGNCVQDPNAEGDRASSENTANSLVAACEAAKENTVSQCDSESNGSWLSEASQVLDVVESVNAQNSSGGAADSAYQSMCGKVAAVNKATKASLATLQVMCGQAYNSCKEACTITSQIAIPAQVEQMRAYRKACDAAGERAKGAQQNAARAVVDMAQTVKQCGDNLGGLENLAANHCDIPGNQDSPACRKIQAANLMPVGDSGMVGPSAGINHQGVGGAGTAATGGAGGFDLDSLGQEDSGGVGAFPVKQGEEIGGAKGGGRVAGGNGGSGAGAGGGGGGRGLSGLLSNILSGFFGGGGGGGSGSSRGGGFRDMFGGDRKEKVNAAQKVPDLRQFMPGGRNDPRKNRGIAGQFIGRDGISGPHADIWRLVNNRYQHKRLTLLP